MKANEGDDKESKRQSERHQLKRIVVLHRPILCICTLPYLFRKDAIYNRSCAPRASR